MLLDTLNLLGVKVAARYPNLNQGGCCVYAALVARELSNRMIPVKGLITTFDPGSLSLDVVRQRVNNNSLFEWKENSVSFYHVGLEFTLEKKTFRYDSNGVVSSRARLLDCLPYKGRLTVNELEDLADDNDWNRCFNRQNIPAIRLMVKNQFKKDFPK
jgi:hypothetical protein